MVCLVVCFKKLVENAVKISLPQILKSMHTRDCPEVHQKRILQGKMLCMNFHNNFCTKVNISLNSLFHELFQTLSHILVFYVSSHYWHSLWNKQWERWYCLFSFSPLSHSVSLVSFLHKHFDIFSYGTHVKNKGHKPWVLLLSFLLWKEPGWFPIESWSIAPKNAIATMWHLMECASQLTSS